MTFSLTSENVFDYLIAQGLCTQEEQELSQIEAKSAKNFNLLVSSPSGRQLLVKQERYRRDGKTAGELLSEWRIQKFLQQFPELSHLRFWLPEVLHFDADNSLIVVNYLDDHPDLGTFYAQEKVFPTAIASSIGTILATIHRLTLDRQDYRDFFSVNPESGASDTAFQQRFFNFARRLERIGPEVFGQVPADGLKFFALYQRYDSFRQAIADLSNACEACCLTHNDFKLNNILLPRDWEQATLTAAPSSNSPIRLILIDWERSSWGDPAFDLGSLIASYLRIWLRSLIVSKSIAIQDALRLVETPLELLQPSLAALASAYLANFPQILERRPDFVQRVVQFAGLGLIQGIQSTLQYRKFFGNTEICMLQVAKSLLCRPQQSIPTVFGIQESEVRSQKSGVREEPGHFCSKFKSKRY